MATAVLEGTVTVQAAVISYAEGFMLIGVLCAVVLPLVFFAKIKKGEAVVATAH